MKRFILLVLTIFSVQAFAEPGLQLVDGDGFSNAALLETDHQIHVTGPIVRATVAQRFRNPLDAWSEGAYRLPLPDGAIVDSFSFSIDGHLIDGVVKPKPQARQEFAQARAAGKTAAITEQSVGNRFRFRVTNIPPSAEVVVTVGYQLQRPDTLDEQELRIPLAIPALYKEQSALTAAIPESRLTVSIDGGPNIATVFSPSHEVAVFQVQAGRADVELANWVTLAADDFVLRWQYEDFAQPLVTMQAEKWQQEHYLLLNVLPGSEAPLDNRPRDLTFILDRSGSMHGMALEQAKEAALWALTRLRSVDRFNIIAFSNEAVALFPEPQTPSSSALDEATGFITDLTADGGTNALAAIENALLAPEPAQGRLAQIVFLTDGAVAFEEQIFTQVRQLLGKRRLFSIGIGAAPNGHFLGGLAKHGRGTFLHIDFSDDIAQRMMGLFEKLEHSVLTDLHWEWTGSNDLTAAPARLPDLYSGEPLRLTFKAPVLDGQLILRGFWGQQAWETSVWPGEAAADTGIHKLWAHTRINDPGWQKEQGESLTEMQTNLAVAHQILTPQTALIAVDNRPARPVDENLHKAKIAGRHIGALPQTGLGLQMFWLFGALCMLLSAWFARSRNAA